MQYIYSEDISRLKPERLMIERINKFGIIYNTQKSPKRNA